MSAIEEWILVDRQVRKLLRAMLRAGVMEDQAVTRSDAGTLERGVISPCLCNVEFLDPRLDRRWTERGHGELVRFVDDMVVMRRSRQEVRRALRALRLSSASWGSTFKEAKDADRGVARRWEGGILGFHHRWARNTPASKHLTFLARWPSRQAPARARGRIRELTDRPQAPRPGRRCRAGPQRVPAGLGGYFRQPELHRRLRHDHVPRRCALGRLHCQASQTAHPVWMGF